jgi:hypothetical protein
LRKAARNCARARLGTLCATATGMNLFVRSVRSLVGVGCLALAVAASGCAAETDDGAAPDDGDDGVSETSEAITTFTSFQRHNLSVINGYRSRKGLVPLKLSPALSTFAHAGSVELSQDHSPHAHFIHAGASIFNKGFKLSAGENQGDPHGWPVLVPGNVTANRDAQIDDIQKAMFDEGPGKGEAHGHYQNMMNAKFRRVGVGLVDVGGKLYLTNDYSQ